MTPIEKRIEKWKSLLLDLGRRNKLIDFKESKRSSLKIIRPDLRTLFSLLSDEKNLEFIYTNSKKETVGLVEENQDKVINPEEIKLKANQLLTTYDDYNLYHALSNIRKKSRTAIEEQGINILYVAFGLLEWKDHFHGKDTYRSPLLLVPVSLVQPGPNDFFQLSITDEEILLNPSLVFKIEKDWKIKFPEFDVNELESIDHFFAEYSTFVKKHDWNFIEEAYLGLFSFAKINMYKDLENHFTQVSKHFFIQSLCGETNLIPEIPEELKYFNHDSVSPNDTYEVINADSSQLDAIKAISLGHSIVLHGPPGTGKSQTITNIIADCLARNRKVLFVSEKMAALQVVYKRLQETELSDFCLKLHSLKTNKKEVISDLASTLHNKKINIKNKRYE